MRELKFRAWDKERKQFNTFELDNDAGFYNIFYRAEKSKYAKKDSDWMQYTNLKDKNGKEIYEGDIIKEIDHNLTIEWINNGFWCKGGDGSNIMPSEECREIIGNIYENPELLEKD